MNKHQDLIDSPAMASLIANASTMAEILNLSKRRIYQLTDEGILEKKNAKFDVVPCIHNYLRYLQSLTPTYADAEEELKVEQIRLTKAKADKAEIEARLAESEVVSVADVTQEWRELALEIRTRLLNIPQRATLRLLGEQEERAIKAILTDEVRQTLTRLATEPLLELKEPPLEDNA